MAYRLHERTVTLSWRFAGHRLTVVHAGRAGDTTGENASRKVLR
jgi:hypothetical protein